MADSIGMDVRQRTEKLVHVELRRGEGLGWVWAGQRVWGGCGHDRGVDEDVVKLAGVMDGCVVATVRRTANLSHM